VSDKTLTDEQHQRLERIKDDPLLRLAFAAYLGETCLGCGKTIDTYEDMVSAVWWPHNKGRIGHKRCFDAARKEAQP
jgi:hypothetical protein